MIRESSANEQFRRAVSMPEPVTSTTMTSCTSSRARTLHPGAEAFTAAAQEMSRVGLVRAHEDAPAFGAVHDVVVRRLTDRLQVGAGEDHAASFARAIAQEGRSDPAGGQPFVQSDQIGGQGRGDRGAVT
jgi:hypothetical protein